MSDYISHINVSRYNDNVKVKSWGGMLLSYSNVPKSEVNAFYNFNPKGKKAYNKFSQSSFVTEMLEIF